MSMPEVVVTYCTGHPKLFVWNVTKNGKRVLIPNSAYIKRLFEQHQKKTLVLKLRSRKCPKCLG